MWAHCLIMALQAWLLGQPSLLLSVPPRDVHAGWHHALPEPVLGSHRHLAEHILFRTAAYWGGGCIWFMHKVILAH